jgi:hypothetical protein
MDSIGDLADRLPPPGTVDVTIEVVGIDLGDQVEAQKLPWHALIYDVSSRTIEISVGGRDHTVPVVLRHEIHNPARVWVEDDFGSVRAISVEAGDGVQTIVRFHVRPALRMGQEELSP